MRKPKRKISLFNFLIGIFAVAVIIILYVNNILSVNDLSIKNNNLREDLNRLEVDNNSLKTEIERLSTFEKIKIVAIDKMGMYYSGSKNRVITINASEIEDQ